MRTEQFSYSFRASGLADIGRRRSNNQDEVVLCPEIGFFAVSDGMGGLTNGKITSDYIARSTPEIMRINYAKLEKSADTGRAETLFQDSVRMLSDRLFETGNAEGRITYGATIAGMWLIGNKAIFTCLGDSRGYLLSKYKKYPQQITEDQNIAGILVKQGELTREQAKNHPASSRLTAFVGMKPPSEPELFTVEVHPGDRILLCSDGLYDMVEERDIARILRSSQSPERVCKRLIDQANESGGRDNISAVYVKIAK